MVTEKVKETKATTIKIDTSAILKEIQSAFKGADKGLGTNVSTGRGISRPVKDSDFVIYEGNHWQKLTDIKGLPFGKISQIAGRPDSGKSSHAMAFMKSAQDQGVVVIFWDTEGKFSPNRFEKFFKGDPDNMFVVPSRMILQGGDQLEATVDAIMKVHPDKKILIVWDSVGGALSASEDEKDFRESVQMAQAAKENGKVVRGIIRMMEKYKDHATNEEKIAALLINQTYANIGAPGQKESGGQKVEYFSSLILQLTRKKDLTKVKGGIKYKIGIVTRAKVKKNHLFDAEDSVAELDLLVTAGGIRLASEAKLKGTDEAGYEGDDGEVEELD